MEENTQKLCRRSAGDSTLATLRSHHCAELPQPDVGQGTWPVHAGCDAAFTPGILSKGLGVPRYGVLVQHCFANPCLAVDLQGTTAHAVRCRCYMGKRWWP